MSSNTSPAEPSPADLLKGSPAADFFESMMPRDRKPGDSAPEFADDDPVERADAPAISTTQARTRRWNAASMATPLSLENLQLADVLRAAAERGASDVLLAADAPPMIRVAGDLEPAMSEPLTPEIVEDLCRQIMSEKDLQEMRSHQDADFSHSFADVGRFRLNVHMQKGSFAAAIRFIATDVPQFHQLNLPPAIEELTKLKNGLVLVTGQTGSGKSTTLAAIIEHINQRDAKHIITLEDPVEFQFDHGRSLLEQREVGRDCPSFESGLKHILRQDPDVILVGELRDLNTIRCALQAAETGHLVFATLHTSTAPGAIDRIVEVFPADEQAQIRSHLGECLKAAVNQRLLKKIGGGRVCAMEIMIVTRAIATNIREGTAHLIPGMMSVNRKVGMQTMEQALKELELNNQITEAEAADHLQELSARD